MGAPLGNQNAVRANLWRGAIMRALRKRSKSDQLEALDELAEKFIDAVGAGDMAAFREIGDRLDGKPKQQIEATGADGGAIQIIINSDDSSVV